ncbi:MAG: 1-deoxy-D-xylulose-5-phosphate reductoisomerase [Desulfovibrionaceae bacterium]
MRTYISTWPADAAQPPFPRGLAVLGATGSIGVNALKVAARHPELFRIVALTGGRNVERLAEQAAAFRPGLLAVLDPAAAEVLRALLPTGYTPKILHGPEGFLTAATHPDADMVLSAIVGAAGFPPTLAAARAGKWIALANKESLVLGGHLIRAACAESGAVILPVDSEHNALFQGLLGHRGEDLRRLVLTASGGPFRGRSRAELAHVGRDEALHHPNWSMGPKVTIDSATLMNKGLELIEACHLYGLPAARVAVVVHPQSIVHSLTEYVDGSLLAHLGVPDMRIPIAHCLCYPRRVELGMEPLDLVRLGSLTFQDPDPAAFPCLDLARRAHDAGPSWDAVLNAANEVAVAAFLEGRIGFMDIPAAIERALSRHAGADTASAEAVLELDARTRAEARKDVLALTGKRPQPAGGGK